MLNDLLNNINETNSKILNKRESLMTRIVLYGDESLKNKTNLLILNAATDFVLSTKRFYEPLYFL